MKKIVVLTFILYCFALNFVQAEYFVSIHTIDSQPGVALNEILPNPEGSDSGKEWIELYNYSTEPVDLTNWILRDTSTKEFFIENTVLLSGEFLVVYPNFSLNQSNEEIFLYDQNDNLVDSFAYESSSEGLSFAKIPDGIGEWTENQYPTDGESNNPEIIIYPETVFISEIYPTPAENEQEWLELFNNSKDLIDLSGWQLSDLSNTITLQNIEIEAYEYLTLAEEALTGITLNNSGDTISLLNPNGEIVHKFVYEKTNSSVSNILYEDNVFQTKAITPGAQNIYVDPNDCFYDATEITSISEFKGTDFSADTKYKLKGIITATAGQIYTNKIYVQDKSGGLMIDLPNNYSKNLSIGKNIYICGYHDAYYQEDELDVDQAEAITLLGTNSKVGIILTNVANEALVGQLVTTKGEIIENGSSTITIQTQKQQIKIKLSHIELAQKKSKGDSVEIVGILTRYGDTKDGEPYYKLVPRSKSDVKITSSNFKNVSTAKTKTSKSNYKTTSNKLPNIKVITIKSLTNNELNTPKLQEKVEGDVSLGIERKPQNKEQISLRVVTASGFLISGSSLFLLFSDKGN